MTGFPPAQHFELWPRSRLICAHAEERTTAAVILLAELYKRPVHICHVARRDEVGVVGGRGWWAWPLGVVSGLMSVVQSLDIHLSLLI